MISVKFHNIVWKDKNGTTIATGVKELFFNRAINGDKVVVTISNPCGSTTHTVNLYTFTGREYPILGYPSLINPPDEFIVFDYKYYNLNTKVLSTGADVYNYATEWKIEFLSGQGNWTKVAGSTYPHALTNGEVKWDLKLGGTYVQNGAYNLKVSFKYCSNEKWESNHNWGYRRFICTTKLRFNYICLCRLCKDDAWILGPLEYLEKRRGGLNDYSDVLLLDIEQ